MSKNRDISETPSFDLRDIRQATDASRERAREREEKKSANRPQAAPASIEDLIVALAAKTLNVWRPTQADQIRFVRDLARQCPHLMFHAAVTMASRASWALLMTGDQQQLARHAKAALEKVQTLLREGGKPGVEIIEVFTLEDGGQEPTKPVAEKE